MEEWEEQSKVFGGLSLRGVPIEIGLSEDDGPAV
jgi:hypothetical protein